MKRKDEGTGPRPPPARAQKIADDWEQRVTKDVYDLMAFPGARWQR